MIKLHRFPNLQILYSRFIQSGLGSLPKIVSNLLLPNAVVAVARRAAYLFPLPLKLLEGLCARVPALISPSL